MWLWARILILTLTPVGYFHVQKTGNSSLTTIGNDGLKKQLKAHKPELIQILSTELPVNYYDKHVEAAIAEFNSRGISIMDVPEINRKRASKLDQVMTEAANHNDRKAFLEALREWRQCFHYPTPPRHRSHIRPG